MTSFDNAHVIITGGSEGIGLAIAETAAVRRAWCLAYRQAGGTPQARCR